METENLDYELRLSDFKPFVGFSEYSRRNWHSEVGGYAPYSNEVNLRGAILGAYHGGLILVVPLLFTLLIKKLRNKKLRKKTLEYLSKKR